MSDRKASIRKELIAAGYSKEDVSLMLKDAMPDISSGSALLHGVVDEGSGFYIELERSASRVGIPLDSYVYRSVKRILEKVQGGMSLSAAAQRAGWSLEVLEKVASGDDGLRDLFFAAQHEFDMRAMGAISKAFNKGSGKLAVEVLSRQTEDFKPAKQNVEVNKTIDIRQGQVLNARDL